MELRENYGHDYSDFMDDELPIPKIGIGKIFLFLTLFIIGVLTTVISIAYIFSAPK